MAMGFSGIIRRKTLASVVAAGMLTGVLTGLAGAGVAGAGAATSCRAPAGAAVLTLSDTTPTPRISVAPGRGVIVHVPKWSWGHATEVTSSTPAVLRQICSMLTKGGGREAVFVAKRAGTSRLSATVSPASDLMMPGWQGVVTVARA
jgi:hypothetical protein